MAADTPRTLKLNANWDLDFSSGGLVMLKGTDAIKQSITSRLQFFKGEWFLAPDQGVPYFTDVLVKAPSIDALQSIFRTAILETPGVDSIVALDLAFDRAARRLTVTFSVTTDVGLLEPTQVEL